MTKQEDADAQAGMIAYTKWWVAHPWHVGGTPESGKVPPDCDCGCRDKDSPNYMPLKEE